MPVNQQQIARELNVSVMTVSRALRHHPDLAESTRELILKKAEELGYSKHLKKKREVASEKKRGSGSRRVGILFCEDEIVGHYDPFKSGVVRKVFLSIQKECQRYDVETLVETTSFEAGAVPNLVKNRSVEGVFLLGRYGDDIVKKLGGIPALAVSNFVEYAGLPHVVADNFHGMFEATRHLIELGHRRILFLGDWQANAQIFQERSFGYLSAMQVSGLRPDIIFVDRRQESVPVGKIMKHTAVVCSNDSLAYRVKEKLQGEGLEIPRDCSLVSFDNIRPLHESDPITSYEPDWELLGRIAAGLMISSPLAILNHDVAITVPGKLVVHRSTCAPQKR